MRRPRKNRPTLLSMSPCLFAIEQGCEFSSTATAAWIQGLGSLAAVFAAIWIAWRSGLQTQMALKRELVVQVELGCSLAWQAYHFCDEVMRNQLNPLNTPLVGNLDLILELIDRFPVDRHPSGEFALRFANIRRLADGFRYAHRQWGGYVAGKVGDGNALMKMRDLNTEIAKEYRDLVIHAQRLLDAQPGRKVTLPLHPPA